MKLIVTTFLVSVALSAGFSADAEIYTCKALSAVRCLCPASLAVSCKSPDGVVLNASVDDTQKALSLSYQCGTVTGTLPKASENIRNYYGADEIFKADAKAHGKKVDPSVGCSFSFTADSNNLKLYQDPEATNRIDLGGCSWTATRSDGIFSTVAQGVLFNVGSACAPNFPAKTGVCGGEISCKGKKAELKICESSGDGTCPTATECALQTTRSGNPNKLKATTLAATDPQAKGFPSGKVAILKTSDGKTGVCFASVQVNGKDSRAGCLYQNGTCGTDASCIADTCVNGVKSEEQAYPKSSNAPGASGPAGLGK